MLLMVLIYCVKFAAAELNTDADAAELKNDVVAAELDYNEAAAHEMVIPSI